MTEAVEVDIEGRRLRLSNLDKVLYPAAGFTKAAVIDYYTRIAPALLGHLAGRPLTMKRYPDGVEGKFFYEKECPGHRPDWVTTAAIPSGSRGKEVNYCVIDSLAALVWAANLADLELHTSLSRAGDMPTPTLVAFDLDPGEGTGLLECARVAVTIRDVLGELGLRCQAKTSGSKGMQVYMPLNTPCSYEDTRAFARALAEGLAREHPDLIVANMRRDLRRGRVLIDWSQNHRAKTTVCVYSLRATARPMVSAPLGWEEVEAALAAGDPDPLRHDAASALERLDRHGDLFADVLDRRQQLPDIA